MLLPRRQLEEYYVKRFTTLDSPATACRDPQEASEGMHLDQGASDSVRLEGFQNPPSVLPAQVRGGYAAVCFGLQLRS